MSKSDNPFENATEEQIDNFKINMSLKYRDFLAAQPNPRPTKVICSSNEDFGLTIGKEYDVIRYQYYGVIVIDDNGHKIGVNISYFK